MSMSNPSYSSVKISAFVAFLVAVVAVVPPGVQPAQAQTYTMLFSFNGPTGGTGPLSLLRNSQGDLLGATVGGGASSYNAVFFKLSSGSNETVLYHFPSGAMPMGRVARDAAGNFYGTTDFGGASNAGTIYKMDKAGNVTTLFSFHQYVGVNPEGGVIIDSAGNLYGTTSAGGGTSCQCGVVFELSSAGKYTVLHRFVGGTDGSSPRSSLLRDSLGNLYGTTLWGGGGPCTTGCGTVFKVSAAGVEKIMHRFAGSPNDGANPLAGLIRDASGNFYGTTYVGGTLGTFGGGTVFRMDKTGNLTVLYSLRGGTEDGANPMAPLVMDSSGNLYGTTSNGGGSVVCGSGCGTVFKLDSSGVETILHSFTGQPDGRTPQAGLTLGSDGNLYGTTWRGGTFNAGTVFKITP